MVCLSYGDRGRTRVRLSVILQRCCVECAAVRGRGQEVTFPPPSAELWRCSLGTWRLNELLFTPYFPSQFNGYLTEDATL